MDAMAAATGVAASWWRPRVTIDLRGIREEVRAAACKRGSTLATLARQALIGATGLRTEMRKATRARYIFRQERAGSGVGDRAAAMAGKSCCALNHSDRANRAAARTDARAFSSPT